MKTTGGNILFLDAGLTNMRFRDIRGDWKNIPKLYWGISIYFRPIDKNTRRTSFLGDFDPRRNKGCKCEVDTAGERHVKSMDCGPDYGIVSRFDFRQHLSLNIGLTVGGMQKAEFGNLYNNMSLLIGPAYRFRRAFKASAGLALAMRNSANPLISEKQIRSGLYTSLSVDIDFIQGLKDISSLLFK